MKLILIALAATVCSARCPTDEYCAECKENNCNVCFAGYALNGVCVKHSLFVENCWSYEFDGFCKMCAPGYFVNQIGKCDRIVQSSCALYDLIDTCTACTGSIKISNRNCDSGVKCSAANCAICTAVDICKRCENGYYLTKNNLCVKPVTEQSNCMILNETGCSLCKYGYYNKNSGCELSSLYKSARILGGAIFSLIFALLN